VIYLNKQLKIIHSLNIKKKGMKENIKILINILFFIHLEVVLFMMYLLKMIGVK
jgi:hypothetical protein